MMDRRSFLISAVSFGASTTGSWPSIVLGDMPRPRSNTFIKIFMRGGADGLHLFPKSFDMAYFQARPNLAIEAPNGDANSSISLGSLASESQRTMNPNLLPLMEIWDDGRMMVAPATAISFNNRSHFDAQRWIGNGAQDNLIDGYMNRYLRITSRSDDLFRGVVSGKIGTSGEMQGKIRVPVVPDIDSYGIHDQSAGCPPVGCSENSLLNALREMASEQSEQESVLSLVRDNQRIMVNAVEQVEAAKAAYTSDTNGREYSNSELGRGLKGIAQMLKGDVPIEVATIDWNIGWDTHANQIASSSNRFTDQGFAYHNSMRQGAEDLLTFYYDMRSYMDRIVVMAGSEFGRTVAENGSRGTDHGHGGAYFAFGGNVTPGFGPDVETVDPVRLKDGRYIPGITDVRDLTAEILVKHMIVPESTVSQIFPGYSFTDFGLFGDTQI